MYKPSNETRLVAIAQVVPVSILFDIHPKEFEPETTIALTAKVLNATSSQPLQGYTVTFYMVKAVLNTNDVDGSFSLTLNLQPASNRPTVYRITASFDGDTPSNATAYAYTPNGTRYAVCTTIQFGYKPSSHIATLTVEPQATQVETPTKTLLY